MVTARSAAMAFNRWADARLDAANPRTAARAIPAGLLSRRFVAGFTVVMSLAFVLAAAQLNRETLLLSPLVLAVLLLYSYTKRFTRWSHLVLGLALGIAPAAAWIAIRGTLDPRIVVLTAAVLFWVGGFDVLYACQDMAHDREAGLNSIPRNLGNSGGLLDCARYAPDHAGPVVLAAEALCAQCHRLGRSGGGRPSAALRASHHLPHRPAAPECRVFYHEWDHFDGLLLLCRGGPTAPVRQSR